MIYSDDLTKALQAWSPSLAESLSSLAYLGSEPATEWLANSGEKVDFEKLFFADGHKVVAHLWKQVLDRKIVAPAPSLLLMLEHLRKHPSVAAESLLRFKLTFSKSLANIAFRAAESLHKDARYSYADDEIDVAILRFKSALSEFRFSIESKYISDSTRRIATGMYATAVAMVGRWVNVAPEAITRALAYSHESMGLGNLEPETLNYRMELLVLQFDQTGNSDLLREALGLVADHKNIAKGSELAEAEARFRLALLADPETKVARRYFNSAKRKLAEINFRSSAEETRQQAISTLIALSEQGPYIIPARSAAIPRGLLILMATEPSAELWRCIRTAVGDLERLRAMRHSAPPAVLSARLLRQMVNGPAELLRQEDISLYVDVTHWLSERSTWNRHSQWEAGASALSAAKRTGNLELALLAQKKFHALAVDHSAWPLPRIGIARVNDYLASLPNSAVSPSTDSWREAATLALKTSAYGRSNLGGRNEVFAVADAKGFLSETFVFKRTTKAKAEHEAAMLRLLREEISQLDCGSKFEVPRSLAIVEVDSGDERQWVHVSQRAAGRLVSELSEEEASKFLEPIVELLAVFHRVAGTPPAGKSAWKTIKEHLKLWLKTLFESERSIDFLDSLRQLFPTNLPLVRKRDGHASNWLVDPAGRIVAIDLESSEFVPIGYDVAQLIEDNALITANTDGWFARMAVFERYLNLMSVDISTTDASAAYQWFALTRALRLGTEREASKQLRRHARDLCALLVEVGNLQFKAAAQELLFALSRIEQPDTTTYGPSHDHRRLSKSMAYLLRHKGPSHGITIDKAGFATIEALALGLNADSSQILAVAEHPGEPRFEIREGNIRALYGHSLDVVVDDGIHIGTPSALFHGSTWSALDLIVKNGLIPMQRRMVHLTNTTAEASSVGGRKGEAIVLGVDIREDEEVVAEGIWVVPDVSPDRLTIVNIYSDESGVAR
ncbi:RNA:NAD 2'-phosphotransferase [plant metagenome]|uniref:RNA:NAD 2'-phosphotransferase n=1 Tax=plant metagenome TaxID=1297885 RepID=A0A484Q7C2_9ZZZZ